MGLHWTKNAASADKSKTGPNELVEGKESKPPYGITKVYACSTCGDGVFVAVFATQKRIASAALWECQTQQRQHGKGEWPWVWFLGTGEARVFRGVGGEKEGTEPGGLRFSEHFEDEICRFTLGWGSPETSTGSDDYTSSQCAPIRFGTAPFRRVTQMPSSSGGGKRGRSSEGLRGRM